MKKLLVTLLVLGAIGGGGYYAYKRFFAIDQKTACSKLAELCDAKGDEKRRQCEELFAKMEKVSGKESVQKSVTCVLESQTCAKSMGCMVGMGVGALGEFLEGIKRSVQQQ
jgi:hypothetical protein